LANKDVDEVQISSRKISERFASIERVELEIVAESVSIIEATDDL